MIRRVLRRLRDDDSGLSLAELLVSGLLTIAIMAMIGTMFIQTAKITQQSNQTTKSNNVAANMANEITSVLRVAANVPKSGAIVPDPAIVTGSREYLEVYSLSNTSATNPVPVKVTFAIDTDRNLKVTRCTGVASGQFYTYTTCGTTETRNLGGAVQALTGAGDQLFTYYNQAGAEIVIGAGTLTAAQRATVSSVRVYISVKAAGSDTKRVVISNKVVLGNLGLDNG